MERLERLEIVPVRCARCGFPAPVACGELLNPGPNPESHDGDAPDLPVLVPVPEGFLPDPDDPDSIIHRHCAHPDEIEAYDLALLDTEAALLRAATTDPRHDSPEVRRMTGED